MLCSISVTVHDANGSISGTSGLPVYTGTSILHERKMKCGLHYRYMGYITDVWVSIARGEKNQKNQLKSWSFFPSKPRRENEAIGCSISRKNDIFDGQVWPLGIQVFSYFLVKRVKTIKTNYAFFLVCFNADRQVCQNSTRKCGFSHNLLSKNDCPFYWRVEGKWLVLYYCLQT